MSRLAAVLVVVSRRQNVSELSRRQSALRVCCDSYNVESDNYAVDRRRSHFVIVRLEVVQG